MKTLGLSRSLPRLVLAWFVLFVGVSTAAPLVKRVDWQRVCAASGDLIWVAVNDDSGDVVPQHLLDCPACLPGLLPAPPFGWTPPRLSGLHIQPLPSLQAARQPRSAAAPLPARGPPLWV